MTETLSATLVVSAAVMGCVVVVAALILAVTLAIVMLKYMRQFSYPAELALRRGATSDYGERALADAQASGRVESAASPEPQDDTLPRLWRPGKPVSQMEDEEPFPT